MKTIVFILDPELEELSTTLGYEGVQNVQLVRADSKKSLLQEIKKVKGKKLIAFKPPTEDLLRFSLEKTRVDIVFGFEGIHPKDSVHYRRGAIDQITCKIAKSKGKMIGFSFTNLLESRNRSTILGRMMANAKLCRKYKVKIAVDNFSSHISQMRSSKDLAAFTRVLKL